jgi:hypothetical protein
VQRWRKVNFRLSKARFGNWRFSVRGAFWRWRHEGSRSPGNEEFRNDYGATGTVFRQRPCFSCLFGVAVCFVL